MMLRIAGVAVVGFIAVGYMTYKPPCCDSALASAPATEQTVKRYEATITRKDDKNNTKTFTDYCEAKSNSEATTIFKERYPGATVSGVRETK